jgi:hypothetical protein
MAKRVALAVCGIVFCAMCLSGCGKQPDNEQVLRTAVDQINTQTPMKIDEITRLDSASYVLPTTLHYHYTLALDSLSEAERADMVAYMRATMPDRLRAESGSAAMSEMSITLHYLYNNPAGELLYEVAIAPEEYAPVAD